MAISLTFQHFRASFVHFTADPSVDKSGFHYLEDAVLTLQNGHVVHLIPYKDFKSQFPKANITDYSEKLIMPGFVDTHIHYPQTEMIAAPSSDLLSWLHTYTFATEARFKDVQYGLEVAEFFLHQLLKNGTTTALVFGTVHASSVEAFFQKAAALHLRMICGKVMMDRNAPEALLDTPSSSYHESKQLIEKWHRKDRLQYAVTPRFAITSSAEQLQIAGQLLEEFPDVYLHTHLSENKAEIELTKALFPDCNNYLEVYQKAHLLQEKSVFAHGIHLEDAEWKMLQDHRCNLAFCPTSNLFLGSGLFHLSKAEAYHIPVGMGTDVGAGTSFSMFQTLQDAYKVTQLQNAQHETEQSVPLSAVKSFYLATLGGARALHLDAFIGNFETGKEADFIVVDWKASSLLKFRMENSQDIDEKLFVLQTLADDRVIEATYILGQLMYTR